MNEQKMWYIYTHKKGNFAIYNNMNEHTVYYAQWSQSETDKYHTSLIYGILKKQNETDS